MTITVPLLKVAMPDTARAAAAQVLGSGFIAQWAKVAAFEAALAGFFGNPNVAAVSDPSGALALALRMAGVGQGDEVIVSPMACTATTMPIAAIGARPAWCDVDSASGMPGAEQIECRVGPRTRAILVYHWSGEVADLGSIRAMAARHGIAVIEDASEAFGAEHAGMRLGHSGSFATIYSFQAVRHLSTGEGGAMVFTDPAQCQRARRLRKFGIDGGSFRTGDGEINMESDIPEPGLYLPMNEVAAAIGLAQMDEIEARLARYRDNGAFLMERLAGVPGLDLPPRRQGDRPGLWTFSLQAEGRDQLAAKLRGAGIGCQRLHIRNDRYSCFGTMADLPGAARFESRTLSIPCGWWVGDEDRERMAACIRAGW
ncbi:MAG: DegT/DnrJ/EryC1/StrS family aminotransferase [Magnetospirillum sp.]|nr:DegT/DnrJ/EryC1/StrS family aminotransferase [Magnetospirillum sp.]